MDIVKKAMVVSPFFPPFPRVGSTKRVENFVKYLPENKWEPIILTMDWGYNNSFIRENLKIYYTRNIATASWKAYQAADIETVKSWKSILMRKFIGFLRVIKKYTLIPDELILWVSLAIPKSRKLIKVENPDIIYVSAPPYSSLLTSVLLKKIYKIPLVCDIRDDWIENPLIAKDNELLNWMERKMENWVVHNSDKIVLVTPASYEMWSRRYPENRNKLCLIENGYNEAEFSSIPGYTFQDFALVHVGSLELNRSPELIFRALSKINAKEKGIHFYQYGLTLRDYRDMASNYSIEDVIHLEGLIDSDDAIARIKGASILVLLPTQNAPTAIPGKAYEYLRTGNPILLISKNNATTEFMKSFSNVYHVETDDEEKCLETIKKIYEYKDTLKTNINNNNKMKKYEKKELTKTLAGEFNSLLKMRHK